MPLSDSDPADQHDIWTRVITVGKHWNADGTLHNAAFSGRNVIAEADQARRHWSHELSGDLLSLIPNLRLHSEGFCARWRQEFHGTMFQTVENLRTDGSGDSHQSPFPTDVRYTPREDN